MLQKLHLPKIFLFIIFILFICIPINKYNAEQISDIRLEVNGKDITEFSSPVIRNNRMLVPIRFVSENMGAEVFWNENKQTVTVKKARQSIFLTIGSHLVEYNSGKNCSLIDSIPLIINDRTYVPIRLISNALGTGIEWDENARIVKIKSDKSSLVEPFYDIKITSVESGDTISKNTKIQLSIHDKYYEIGSEMKIILVDKNETSGFIIAESKTIEDNFIYVPKIEDNGEKIIIAAIYDKNGMFIGGDALPVLVDIKPEISFSGAENFQLINETVTLKAKVNFPAVYVKYEIKNLDNDEITLTTELDSNNSYSWNPWNKKNGKYSIRIIAYDSYENAYEGETVFVDVNIEKKISLSGVSEGMTINKPVTLIASRNFDVLQTEYIIKDVATGKEETLALIPYGGYDWFPGPDYSGQKQLKVRVWDTAGKILESQWINVYIDGAPKILLIGIGPKQVLTKEATLKIKSNVPLKKVNYILTDLNTGKEKFIGENIDYDKEFTFYPDDFEQREISIYAKSVYKEEKLISESIPFTIYLHEIFGPEAIVEKDKFIELISIFALKSRKDSGMSAALQTAQAILETGWGQSVPVDKYKGNFSYNIFGIKGEGTNGSVISNTWEVYNGISFRTDANFRAYNNIEESWNDHKKILLNLSRYETFRSVMYDYIFGALEIRRAGYATDPAYPIKLIRIINRYDLKKLDFEKI